MSARWRRGALPGPEGVTMTIFVSYTRADESLVRALRDDVGRMGHQVWLDHEIHGGELWWREIIRAARVFVAAGAATSTSTRPTMAATASTPTTVGRFSAGTGTVDAAGSTAVHHSPPRDRDAATGGGKAVGGWGTAGG
ncbi:toll/interleukin-1 receptor domain-containing protein [Actinosynnema sp. NPDC023658]|uniref:toll/interleukin-1 receptor domain-containing protein n=1 Tax=Actinosynnema sp. NPDC023658 TaxID=3155465 RepID=UPI0033D08154